MTVNINYNYSISYIGYSPTELKANERITLNAIKVIPENRETLLTEKLFPIPPNTAIPFKVRFKSDLNDLKLFVKKELKSKDPNYDGTGSNVLVKSINFKLEINYLNAQKNLTEISKAEFVKNNLRIGFLLE
jgi:hypothetical protein